MITAMHMKTPPMIALFSGLSPSNRKAHIIERGISLMDNTEAIELDRYLRDLEIMPKAMAEVHNAIYIRPR